MAEAHDRDGRRAITHARARKEPRCQDTNRSFRRGNRTSSEIFRRSHRPTPSGTRNRRGSVSIRVAINGLGRIGRAIRFVLLSAPSKDEDIATVVHGVNAAGSASAIVSCASGATNCITPIVEVVGRRIGFRKAAMTTVHAYTSSQSVVDGPSKRFRRGRAAGANLVPARRVPHWLRRVRCRNTQAGSMASPCGHRFRWFDCRCHLRRLAKHERRGGQRDLRRGGRNEALRGLAGGIQRCTRFVRHHRRPARASVVDLELTRVIDGDLVKIMSWYDNEWGYASQMVREALALTRGR